KQLGRPLRPLPSAVAPRAERSDGFRYFAQRPTQRGTGRAAATVPRCHRGRGRAEFDTSRSDPYNVARVGRRRLPPGATAGGAERNSILRAATHTTWHGSGGGDCPPVPPRAGPSGIRYFAQRPIQRGTGRAAATAPRCHRGRGRAEFDTSRSDPYNVARVGRRRLPPGATAGGAERNSILRAA